MMIKRLAREAVRERVFPTRVPEQREHERDRIEVRLLSFVLTSSFLYDLLEPTLMRFLSNGTSPLHRVMALSQVPDLLVLVFLGALLMTLPMWLSLLFTPVSGLARRLPRWLACQAAIISTVAWFYLAALAQPLDYDALPWLYMRNCCASLVMAALYALSLNAQQVRTLLQRRRGRHEAPVHG